MVDGQKPNYRIDGQKLNCKISLNDPEGVFRDWDKPDFLIDDPE